MAIIGIDLGTTNSLGAVYRNGRVELIPNRFGTFLTPNIVSMDEEENIIVGQIAKERLVSNPQFTAASFKRGMGKNKKYKLGEKFFSPEELSSFVIRSIIEDAKIYLQEEIEEAVISVPAYFNDKQRVATKKAGALAGVTVKRIINEPSAAALASYIDTSKEETFLVFDFGGGTLDVSIVECFDTMVEILSVSGDNQLGGDDFHRVMAEAFLKEQGLERQNVSDKEYAILIKQAEICKQKLTQEEEAQMSAVIGGKTYQSQYTNQRLLEESGPIFSRIKEVIVHALRDGELSMGEIDTIVMVGGSSKMPLVQSYLEFLLKKKPVIADKCDEMVAQGLGLVCAVKERQEEMKDYILTDICPFTLGTDVLNEANPNRPYMSPIIYKNTVLPCSRVEQFCTSHHNQTKIELNILQGEQVYKEDNLELDKIIVYVPKNKAYEETIDVRFTYDINGILLVDITINSTGETISKVVSQNENEEDLQQKIQELSKLKVHPKDMTENKLVLEKLCAFYEEMPIHMRDMIKKYISWFEQTLAEQNPRRIKKCRKVIEEIVESFEDYKNFEQDFVLRDYSEIMEEDNELEEEEEFIFGKGGGTQWTS